jgi:hypothetical protein
MRPQAVTARGSVRSFLAHSGVSSDPDPSSDAQTVMALRADLTAASPMSTPLSRMTAMISRMGYRSFQRFEAAGPARRGSEESLTVTFGMLGTISRFKKIYIVVDELVTWVPLPRFEQ